jgi:hypothetical protein
VRRPRLPPGAPAADPAGADTAPALRAAARVRRTLTYLARDVRLVLAARRIGAPPGAPVRHVAEGDGVRITWTFEAEPEPAAGGAGGTRTRLHARIGVEVDPDHPNAAGRVALCRLVARRAPGDLDRLAALVDRYERGCPPRAVRSGAAC